MPRRSSRSSRRVQEEDQVEEVQVEEEEVEFEEEQAMEEEEEEEEEEENEGKRSKSSSRSRKRQKRAKVMTESGQTELQRRVLRQSQRDLFNKMTDATQDTGDKMMDVNSDEFHKTRKANNKLWNQVRYTREAVLDGDNVDMISKKAARQLDQLISVPRYDATNLANKLRSRCSIQTNSSSSFDWKTFGLEVGSCFNSMPAYCSFLNGPIESAYQPKERKKPVRRAKEEDDAEEEEVKTVTQKTKSKDENKLSAVEKQLKVLSKKLKERSEKDKDNVYNLAIEHEGKKPEDMSDEEKKSFLKRVKKAGAARSCAVQFVMNPDSFTQTVENIFGLSFMVKKGDAEVGVRSFEDCHEANLGTVPGPWVKKTKTKENNGRQQPHARQAIVSFTMQDWRDLREAYNVTEGDIPHRGKKTKQTRVK